MSDGRRPGSLESPLLYWPAGIARGASFTLPPPLHDVGYRARARGRFDAPTGITPSDTRGVDRPSGDRPIPVPQPRAQPTSVVGRASGFLGPVGRRDDVILEYYAQCGLETVGPGQIAVDRPARFTTLEGLIDALQTSSGQQNVIVNHGSPSEGLVVPLCKETAARETGLVMGTLSALADRAQQGPLDPQNQLNKFMFDSVNKDAKIKPEVTLRLVNKLVNLRKKRLTLHFRACNMSDDIVADYRKAFGAQLITFHECRLLFLPFVLAQLNPGRRVDDEPTDRNSPRSRMRPFHDPLGLLAPMYLAIFDRDGHTNLVTQSAIEDRTPDQIHGWAEFLLRQWQDPRPERFVVPVMWLDNDKDLTFHCPLEPGWRKQLRMSA